MVSNPIASCARVCMGKRKKMMTVFVANCVATVPVIHLSVALAT